MKDSLSQKLNPKIKNVWRISDAIWLTFMFIICSLPFLVVGIAIDDGAWALVIAGLLVIAYIVLAMLFLFVITPIRYARWSFDLDKDYLEIVRGIVWRKHFVIPFIRVQNTDTSQGPIMRAFGLSSVTISTAAGAHEIPGLSIEEANLLRDKASEFARLAKEDI